mmetsp:Transcript_30651/g.66922  ORF Transcript_30651/g.66922 Transcript_30651/m.66922 type:complete len:294 (-) Transcript_30651:102-983(-)
MLAGNRGSHGFVAEHDAGALLGVEIGGDRCHRGRCRRRCCVVVLVAAYRSASLLARGGCVVFSLPVRHDSGYSGRSADRYAPRAGLATLTGLGRSYWRLRTARRAAPGGETSAWILFDLPPGAAKDVIKRRYRRLVATEHPDKKPGDPDAERKFKRIVTAYRQLMAGTARTPKSGNDASGGFDEDEEEALSESLDGIDISDMNVANDDLDGFQTSGSFGRRKANPAASAGAGSYDDDAARTSWSTTRRIDNPQRQVRELIASFQLFIYVFALFCTVVFVQQCAYSAASWCPAP